MGSKANSSFFYEDFEPFFEWDLTDPSSDILLIHVPGFKEEHLNVPLDSGGNLKTSGGNLKTSGHRPLEGDRWIRFRKNFRVPENCDVNAIRAKFEKEKLHVLFPRLVDAETPKASPPPPAPGQKVAAEEDKQQKANGKNAEPANATQGRNERKEEKKVKSKEEDKPSGFEEETAIRRRRRPDLDARKEEKLLSKEEDKPNGGEKKTMPPPAPAATNSKAGDGGVEGQGMAGIAMGLTQERKGLLLNVAVATLVLLGLLFYFKYQSTNTET